MFEYHPRNYDPQSGMLRWLHIVIDNVKTFIKGAYHGLPVKYPDNYLD